jgi:hypothetical protein
MKLSKHPTTSDNNRCDTADKLLVSPIPRPLPLNVDKNGIVKIS